MWLLGRTEKPPIGVALNKEMFEDGGKIPQIFIGPLLSYSNDWKASRLEI